MVRSEDGGGLELLDAVLDLLRRVHLAPVRLSVGGDEHELLTLVQLLSQSEVLVEGHAGGGAVGRVHHKLGGRQLQVLTRR